MNAGLFPVPGGTPQGARKVVGVLGRSASATQNSSFVPGMFTLAPMLGVDQFSVTPTLGSRTRIYAVAGRGAARVFALGVDGNCTYRIELLVDGNVLYDRTIVNGSGTSQMQAVVGFANTSSALGLEPDYLLFDGSVEVFVTVTGTSQIVRWAYLMESHQ